ncbi:MAG: nucleotidyltransferase family protein [Microthrixaceae bacterium]
MSVVAVVLAAGSGSRFAGPTHKLRARHEGRSIVERAIEAAVDSGIGPVMVVTGAEPLGDLIPPSVTEIRASHWSAGQSHSLAAAIGVVTDTRADAVVVGLGDMPGVTPQCWASVALSAAPIAVARYDGHRAPPVKLSRDMWSELPSSGDRGARDLMHRRPELVVEVAVEGDARDVDTLEDLDSLT